jgi:biopolymer transport protein TolR
VGALRAGSAQRPLSEINVTPFVDVMLVLLIIFMVTAPMMQQGVDVDLPKTTTQNLRIKDEPLVLTVKQDGKYYLGRKEMRRLARRARPSSGWSRSPSHRSCGGGTS